MTDKNKSPDEGPRFEETFDFDVPPAPIDVNAFARHAGEIIASATAAKQSKYRSGQYTEASPPVWTIKPESSSPEA
jgi:hypothetical protein